jgi:glycosyltransferase involved in cell wall biosynthesis
MAGMPRLDVSVVIPTYNRAALVARAVRSALATLEDGDEVIVPDDGSTDGTAAALLEFGPRVRHLALPHRGAGPTRNAGIAAARGPLVAFLDSDDEWLPGKTALQRRFHEARPDVLFSFTDFAVREEDGTEHRRYLARWQEKSADWDAVLGPAVGYASIAPSPGGAPLPPGPQDLAVRVGDLFAAEAEDNFVATFTLVVRKDLAGDALRFAEDLPTYEDWECFGRLARKGPAAFLDVETAVQHGHAGPRLTKTDPLRAADARLRVLERVWGADAAYLARHGDAYRRVVAAQHAVRARRLLRLGRTRDAREALRLSGDASLAIRALSRLPGPLVRGALRLALGPVDAPR